MRTRRVLYTGKGVIYPCELERCPGCDGEMQTAYTSKYKTVPTMQEVLRIGQWTKRCINPECRVCAEIWRSAQWRQLAPVGCTYGYDVIAQIGCNGKTCSNPLPSSTACCNHRWGSVKPKCGSCIMSGTCLYFCTTA